MASQETPYYNPGTEKFEAFGPLSYFGTAFILPSDGLGAALRGRRSQLVGIVSELPNPLTAHLPVPPRFPLPTGSVGCRHTEIGISFALKMNPPHPAQGTFLLCSGRAHSELRSGQLWRVPSAIGAEASCSPGSLGALASRTIDASDHLLSARRMFPCLHHSRGRGYI